jgi:polysaccharide export outer membrane protein
MPIPHRTFERTPSCSRHSNWSRFIVHMGEKIVRRILLACIGFFALSVCLFCQDGVKDDYIIGTEDVLAVSVWKEPELSVKELVVRPDGKISLPLVNDIQASGLTPKELQLKIAAKLREFVASPNVNITVIKTLSHTVSVIGQVNKPGLYTLGSPTTVLDILARVGGLTEFAKAKNITILRNENGKILQFPFNYKNVIKGKDLPQNIFLLNGDKVLVP